MLTTKAIDAGIYRTIFAENLKKHRIKRGMTQKDLSEASSVDLQAIYRYERASVDASAVNAYKLASALGITMGELFGDSAPSFAKYITNVAKISLIEREEDFLLSDSNFYIDKSGSRIRRISKSIINEIIENALDLCAPILKELIISGIMKNLIASKTEQKEEAEETTNEPSTDN